MPRPPNIPKRNLPAGAQNRAALPQAQAIALVQQGLAAHQQAKFEEAHAFYERALKIQSDNFDALQLLGALLIQTSQFEQAVAVLSKAIAINPRYAPCHNYRGIALKELKRFDEALVSFEQALSVKPDDIDAHYNRGCTLQDLKRLDEAIVSFKQAIALKPDYAEAYNNQGFVLHELQHFDEALISFNQAIHLKAGYAEAYNNLGNTLKALQRLQEALASCDQALAFDPNYVLALNNRGVILQVLKRFEEAIVSFNKAIALHPDYPEAYYNRGIALNELKHLAQALASYEHAIALKPDFVEAHNNRGKVLKELARLDEALASYNNAIAVSPKHPDAYSNRGFIFQEMKRLGEALASYDQAIALKPDYTEALWNKAIALLLTGDFTQGWPLYEQRWDNKTLELKKRIVPQPLWLGIEPLNGKTILLHAEQGFGDTIQFCRYAKLVSALGARVILEAPSALMPLLSGLEGIDVLVQVHQPLPDFDYHCPLLSLPLAFKTTVQTIPGSGPYLKADQTKLLAWKEKLGQKIRPRIGLVWSGNPKHKNDSNRSMTLQQLQACLPDGYDYISLHKEVKTSDQEILDNQVTIRTFSHELNDFSDTAALCELMDVVISVDTSVAHLASALGKETWVLLPYAPDWRWLLDRQDSPWYQSVRLYRQDEQRDWNNVLISVAADLTKRLATFGFDSTSSTN